MTDRDAFKDRERQLEEGYFHKKEAELIERMRQRVAREQERGKLGEQTGVTNEEVLEALQDLGYSSETVRLIHLMPLIHIAWANDRISGRERKMIVEVARSSGIAEGSEADQWLQKHLIERPSAEVIEANLTAIRAILSAVSPEDQKKMRQDLLNYCVSLASLSKGLFGLESRISPAGMEALEKVVEQISPPSTVAAEEYLQG